jgi:PleD family two-component response regulator
MVWVVDDDSTARLLAERVLHDDFFDVRTFADGPSVLEAAQSGLPDILVADVMMPGMDGFELCRALRGLPMGGDLSILMATRLDDVDSIDRAFEAGATDFTIKPINWTIESHRLRYLLRTGELARELRQLREEISSLKKG